MHTDSSVYFSESQYSHRKENECSHFSTCIYQCPDNVQAKDFIFKFCKSKFVGILRSPKAKQGEGTAPSPENPEDDSTIQSTPLHSGGATLFPNPIHEMGRSSPCNRYSKNSCMGDEKSFSRNVYNAPCVHATCTPTSQNIHHVLFPSIFIIPLGSTHTTYVREKLCTD